MTDRPPHITAPPDMELPLGATWHPSADGMWARYTRERVTFVESVLLSEQGNWDAVRAKAIEWYENTRRIFPPLTMVEVRQLRRKNNTSGRTGLSRTRDGKYWRAQYSDADGNRPTKSFRIDEHGDDGAKRLASEWLDEGLAQLPDQPAVRNPSRRFARTASERVLHDVFAYEGDEKYVIHKTKERDPKIRKAKLDAFLAQHGRLFCEICQFSFTETYGSLGENLIEIHHLVPLAEMTAAHKTVLDELMCVCSNCHLVLHNGDPTETLRLLRHLFALQTTEPEKQHNHRIHRSGGGTRNMKSKSTPAAR